MLRLWDEAVEIGEDAFRRRLSTAEWSEEAMEAFGDAARIREFDGDVVM